MSEGVCAGERVDNERGEGRVRTSRRLAEVVRDKHMRLLLLRCVGKAKEQ